MKRQHCFMPKWYCRFMFWMNHGWYINRVYMTMEEMRDDTCTCKMPPNGIIRVTDIMDPWCPNCGKRLISGHFKEIEFKYKGKKHKWQTYIREGGK